MSAIPLQDQNQRFVQMYNLNNNADPKIKNENVKAYTVPIYR